MSRKVVTLIWMYHIPKTTPVAMYRALEPNHARCGILAVHACLHAGVRCPFA